VGGSAGADNRKQHQPRCNDVILGIDLAYWQETVIKVLVILMVIPAGALILGYTFLMKMMSHMQSRLGPMEAGPHGVLQLVADGVKFLQKEDLTPTLADKRVFAMAPLVVLLSTFLLYIVIPASPHLAVENLDTGIFFALAVSSISVIGVLMAGWASANKYSLLGALRAAGQLIAYELPLVLAVIGVVVQAGTMNLQGIVHAQADGEIFGWGGIGNPFILTQIVGFALFLVAAQAELTQTPFDMPVAESELVAGYMTEYSGFRFLFFFMGEFGTAFALSAIAATLFLGGWYVPGLDASSDWYYLIGPAVLFAKIMLVSFFIFWFRFTYPRFREDQLQAIAWKFLIPLALVNILATGILKVVF
jgi:NADH-quinone oxidoreductase subunit H